MKLILLSLLVIFVTITIGRIDSEAVDGEKAKYAVNTLSYKITNNIDLSERLDYLRGIRNFGRNAIDYVKRRPPIIIDSKGYSSETYSNELQNEPIEDDESKYEETTTTAVEETTTTTRKPYYRPKDTSKSNWARETTPPPQTLPPTTRKPYYRPKDTFKSNWARETTPPPQTLPPKVNYGEKGRNLPPPGYKPYYSPDWGSVPTVVPITVLPITEAPTTAAPTTAAPITEAPTTAAPTTVSLSYVISLVYDSSGIAASVLEKFLKMINVPTVDITTFLNLIDCLIAISGEETKSFLYELKKQVNYLDYSTIISIDPIEYVQLSYIISQVYDPYLSDTVLTKLQNVIDVPSLDKYALIKLIDCVIAVSEEEIASFLYKLKEKVSYLDFSTFINVDTIELPVAEKF